LAAIVADEVQVPETFVLTPVGTFPVKDIADSDFEALHCKGVGLPKQEVTCMKNLPELFVTKQLAKEGFSDVYNYETGLPVLMEKTKVAELFEKFNPQKLPTKVISLYLNFFNRDKKPVPVIFRGEYATGVWRSNPNMDIVRNSLQKGTYFLINNDGYLAIQKLF